MVFIEGLHHLILFKNKNIMKYFLSLLKYIVVLTLFIAIMVVLQIYFNDTITLTYREALFICVLVIIILASALKYSFER